MRLYRTAIAVAAVLAVVTAIATVAQAQVITRGRAIVDRPKSTTPGTNCRIINVPVTQPDGTQTIQPRRICE